MTHSKPNRLIHATSPYLLQHAHNPVDWMEWGKEALTRAQQEDKPILVSIGYSSCHWCHVMERESFEDTDIAGIMNEFFVCIKVDREERPDVDQVYMDAIQAMGLNGGWPLHVFLTPDQKPFYGGTYFPPQAWAQVLTKIHQAYQSRKEEIRSSAVSLAEHVARQGISQFRQPATLHDATAFSAMFNQLEEKFDVKDGGLDKAPKFIMPSVWLWLLRYWRISKNQTALDHTLFTLKKIASGGIYDPVGGGFARYAVDGRWFVPHFEKMLYDNAQLISLYSEAYALTKDEFFKELVYQTFNWLTREMTHPEGGFYSALDADSEGVEGKFYCWRYTELEQLLTNDAALVADYFQCTSQGNWEHGMNILNRTGHAEKIATQYGVTLTTLHERITSAMEKLLIERNKRIKPGLDDKILSGWNAMMIAGLVDAYHAFGDEQFLNAALKNISFLEKYLLSNKTLYRSFKSKRSSIEGFLEDYAYLIRAYIKLYQSDFNESWIYKAEQVTQYTIENFYDTKDGYFYFTAHHGEELIARKKEIFDNVIPSSNSVMAQNLFQLGIILDRDEWKTMATSMTEELSHLITQEPNYMSNWGIVLTEIRQGMAEIVFAGTRARHLKNELLRQFQHFVLVMGTDGTGTLPLLQAKVTKPDTTTIYVCYTKTCKLPVPTVEEAVQQLK